MVQRLRIRPPTGDEGSIPGLGGSHLHGAVKPVHLNYWNCALQPRSHDHWAPGLEPVLCSERSRRQEKPVPHSSSSPHSATGESPHSVTKTQRGLNTWTCVLSLSRVWLFATLSTIACQAPLSMGFPRKEYGGGLPSPPPGSSSQPRDRTRVSCVSCLTSGFFTCWANTEALINK